MKFIPITLILVLLSDAVFSVDLSALVTPISVKSSNYSEGETCAPEDECMQMGWWYEVTNIKPIYGSIDEKTISVLLFSHSNWYYEEKDQMQWYVELERMPEAKNKFIVINWSIEQSIICVGHKIDNYDVVALSSSEGTQFCYDTYDFGGE
ncbi:hypothetical protein ACG1BZ_06690 [Microbulbifer sp. CNSA002]|uniref:hypothetical protein n=1 Tax=Microbulbifer sp. CNSA002 TaxID=3373604 RepID=UPI0039B5DEEC